MFWNRLFDRIATLTWRKPWWRRRRPGGGVGIAPAPTWRPHPMADHIGPHHKDLEPHPETFGLTTDEIIQRAYGGALSERKELPYWQSTTTEEG